MTHRDERYGVRNIQDATYAIVYCYECGVYVRDINPHDDWHRRVIISQEGHRVWRLVKDAIEDWYKATEHAGVVSFGEAASAVLRAIGEG